MHQKYTVAGLCAVLALSCWAIKSSAQQLPLEPPHNTGQSITGAFEGWFSNPDGSFSILVGYFNRNLKQEMDIPVGANNRIEPGGPDQGQPTHFLSGRQWGMFTIHEPKEFAGKRLTWTIIANGKTTSIPLDVDTLWEVSPFVEASHNTPPYIGFSESGPFVNGPIGTSTSMTATTGTPLPLTVWVADDAKLPPGSPKPRTPAASVTWTMYRGPGAVKFTAVRPKVEDAQFKAPEGSVFTGKSTTDATFSEPGEYMLNVQGNDWSGEGGRGFQCCWSNAKVKVSVTGAPVHTGGGQ